MKNLLDQYAAFNLWANQRITSAVLTLDEHQQQQVLKSSFPNIYATVLHLWDVESGWFQRVHMHTSVLFLNIWKNTILNKTGRFKHLIELKIF